MAGIYIHIPFCRQACTYCNFHFSTSLQQRDSMIACIVKELELQKNYTGDEIIETIYFGGGTPSLLTEQNMYSVLNTIFKNFKTDKNAEITLEANPDDINPGKLNQLKLAGINRLSIGIQSFADADLRWMNRAHNSTQAHACILHAQENDFENINADLIYGIPGQADEAWMQNIQTLIDYHIPHISCYALTVEPKTVLQHLITSHKIKSPDEFQIARQFELLVSVLRKNNYEQYEISNFALPGKYSKHNAAYWQKKNYLGAGPSAHSYNGFSRQWNIANNTVYMQSIGQNAIPFEIEILTATQKANENIMTSLRTVWGLHIKEFKNISGDNFYHALLQEMQPHINSGNLILENDTLKLSEKGKLFADKIISDLFFIEDEYLF